MAKAGKPVIVPDGNNKGPDPNAAAKQELADLVAKNEATPWGKL